MYMIYQQYITAIRNAYRDNESIGEMYKEAKRTRKWIESLKLDPKLRDPLLEPIAAIEETFQDLLSKS